MWHMTFRIFKLLSRKFTSTAKHEQKMGGINAQKSQYLPAEGGKYVNFPAEQHTPYDILQTG